MPEEVSTIIEQVRTAFVQHAPAEMLQQALPFGILCLVLGVGLSVLGAKISRFGMTCGFAVLGGYIGVFVARETGFPQPVCGLVGAVMVALVGYQTFKLWVGVVAALVLSSVALGVFGYQRVVPHVNEFEHGAQVATMEPAGSFVLPTPEEQEAYRQRGPREWAAEFWAFLRTKDASIERNGRALAVTAALTGLCLGVLAVRWALILATSLIGTLLVTTSMATLLTHAAPRSYETLQHNPGLVGIGVGAFLVTSLILQTLLTRKAPASRAESSTKS
jgi:hypothetical protein